MFSYNQILTMVGSQFSYFYLPENFSSIGINPRRAFYELHASVYNGFNLGHKQPVKVHVRQTTIVSKPSKFNQLIQSMFWYFWGFVCFVCLSWQLLEITTLYLKYDTVTETIIQVPFRISIPSVSICFRYPQIVNRTAFRDLTNATEEFLGSELDLEDFSDKYSLTIEEIFSLTPNGSDVLQACKYRLWASYLRNQ